MVEYIVNFGDTIYSITRDFNLETDELLAVNPGIKNPDVLIPGQIIFIPIDYEKMKRMIAVNGFTLLAADKQIIVDRLRYLTYLSILGYTFLSDGTVVDIDDTKLIQMSREAGVAPLMVISNAVKGFYSANLAHAILSDVELQNTLLSNIVQAMKNKNYYGLVLDFEYLYPSDIVAYSEFWALVNSAMRRLGYVLQLAVRMSIPVEHQDLLKKVFEEDDLQNDIDQFLIMCNELSYTFGHTMFMSPLDQMQRALDAAIINMPRSQVVLGIPNAGYDWTLPRSTGIAAKRLSKEQTIALYKQSGAMLQFDTSTRGFYFNYVHDLGAGHIVWSEDGHGFENYLQLVDTYHLAGVNLLTIDLFTSADYQTLIATHDILKVLNPEAQQSSQ